MLPILYSPVRGVHRRFLDDIKKYTKFISSDEYRTLIQKIKDDLEKKI